MAFLSRNETEMIKPSGTRLSEISDYLKKDMGCYISMMIENGLNVSTINSVKAFSDAAIEFLVDQIDSEKVSNASMADLKCIKHAFAAKLNKIMRAAT